MTICASKSLRHLKSHNSIYRYNRNPSHLMKTSPERKNQFSRTRVKPFKCLQLEIFTLEFKIKQPDKCPND